MNPTYKELTDWCGNHGLIKSGTLSDLRKRKESPQFKDLAYSSHFLWIDCVFRRSDSDGGCRVAPVIGLVRSNFSGTLAFVGDGSPAAGYLVYATDTFVDSDTLLYFAQANDLF